MALFVDGPACTISDLTDEDSGLLETSVSTGINVSTKLRLAHAELRNELAFWLKRQRGRGDSIWTPGLRIEQVIATPALKNWERLQALALVYRDAYFSQFVERYQAKWQEYNSLARTARENLIAEGAGMVSDPMEQAAAPMLGTTTGPQSGGMFYACVAWLNAAGQEGAPSVASSITVPDGNLMTVSAGPAPANAAGFNAYAGTALDSMFRQNDVGVAVGGTFVYVPGEVGTGILPGSGQSPDWVWQLSRTVLRG